MICHSLSPSVTPCHILSLSVTFCCHTVIFCHHFITLCCILSLVQELLSRSSQLGMLLWTSVTCPELSRAVQPRVSLLMISEKQSISLELRSNRTANSEPSPCSNPNTPTQFWNAQACPPVNQYGPLWHIISTSLWLTRRTTGLFQRWLLRENKSHTFLW